MVRALASALAFAALLASPAGAGGGLTLSQAWTPAAAKGANTPLHVTVTNAGGEDSLLRTRCSVANFTEAHAVDQGEGFPSMRTIKAIPIPAGTTELGADGNHVMLLQTTQALADGQSFTCTISFRDAGRQEVEVTVGRPQ